MYSHSKLVYIGDIFYLYADNEQFIWVLWLIVSVHCVYVSLHCMDFQVGVMEQQYIGLQNSLSIRSSVLHKRMWIFLR